MRENAASDLLIYNVALLNNGQWLSPAYLAIRENSITNLAAGHPSEELLSSSSQVIDAAGLAALPGLTNAHTHLSQVFMRGLAGGRPLMPWLQELIWPLQKSLSAEDTHLAALLGLVENLHCGATHVVDNHKITATPAHTDAVLKAAEKIGLHFTLARGWADKGKNPEPAEAVLEDLQRLYTAWKDHPFITIANGPLALWRCNEHTIQETHAQALENQAFTHFHVSESSREVELSIEEYGLRPVDWLFKIGVLDLHTQVVHAVWLEPSEIGHIADSGACVIHCPVSNAVLGSGTAPVAAFTEQGIPILLGTDGPASNDTQDIWETLKAAVCLARITSLDATILPPAQALSMALAGRTLLEGGEADLILVDVSHSRVSPVHDMTSALVLGTHGSDVSAVVSGGKLLMKDKKILVLDEEALLAESRDVVRFLRKKAGLD